MSAENPTGRGEPVEEMTDEQLQEWVDGLKDEMSDAMAQTLSTFAENVFLFVLVLAAVSTALWLLGRYRRSAMRKADKPLPPSLLKIDLHDEVGSKQED